MIEAGEKWQVQWGDGRWIFLDIGFRVMPAVAAFSSEIATR